MDRDYYVTYGTVSLTPIVLETPEMILLHRIVNHLMDNKLMEWKSMVYAAEFRV